MTKSLLKTYRFNGVHCIQQDKSPSGITPLHGHDFSVIVAVEIAHDITSLVCQLDQSMAFILLKYHAKRLNSVLDTPTGECLAQALLADVVAQAPSLKIKWLKLVETRKNTFQVEPG